MNSPAQIAEIFAETGKNKTANSAVKIFILAVLAGVYLALAALGASTASAAIENPSAARLVSACIFPSGLVMITLAGSELFTGNCLMVISCIEKKISVLQLVKCWALVYIGNGLGAGLTAACAAYSHLTTGSFEGQLAASTVAVAAAKVNLSFSECLLRGILCNILVCIGVWVANSSEKVSGKIAAMYFPIVVFVLCGFEHCVANMYYIPAGIFTASLCGITSDGLNWGSYILSNLVPVTIGNIFGGSVVVGLSYWYIYIHKSKK